MAHIVWEDTTLKSNPPYRIIFFSTEGKERLSVEVTSISFDVGKDWYRRRAQALAEVTEEITVSYAQLVDAGGKLLGSGMFEFPIRAYKGDTLNMTFTLEVG